MRVRAMDVRRMRRAIILVEVSRRGTFNKLWGLFVLRERNPSAFGDAKLALDRERDLLWRQGDGGERFFEACATEVGLTERTWYGVSRGRREA